MPPAKKSAAAADEAASANRTGGSTTTAAAARKGRNGPGANAAGAAGTANQLGGNALKELARVTTEAGTIGTGGKSVAGAGGVGGVGEAAGMAGAAGQIPGGATPGNGMAWQTAPLSLLNAYRVAHHLPTPAAFTTAVNHALLTNPGIGRQSPSMARRKKENRRVGRDQLALAVRKHFNGAAVNEIEVVVDLMYKVRNQDKAFRMRSYPGVMRRQTT